MKKEYESIEDMIKDAKKRALSVLERRDRTKKELIDKLTEDGYPSSVVNTAIEYVESYHYLDDSRYAENYIRYHKNNKSKKAVKLYLKDKGIDIETIDAAIEKEYDNDEKEMIKELFIKRHYNPETADYKEKNRMMAYCMRRGFSLDDIKSLL
ncbi:MAG: regulatory protein RecX [Lachnospiraceae bacterium]|nr:regulatory protein RecX [Lachnospiraceae bacterium]MBR5788688.1 regulatory protein RecX [Lachnospiraceae bacterium]